MHAAPTDGPPPGAVDPWVVRYHGYDPADEGRREALCTLGNGYLATRGAGAESSADGVHYPGTYVAGLYDRAVDHVAGRDVGNESLVNVPNWLVTRARASGPGWWGLDGTELLAHTTELDLRRAVLTRRSRFRDDAGRTTSVVERRLVSMDLAHACALEVTYVPEDWAGELHVRTLLDGSVTNDLVERYRGLSTKHLDLVRAEVLPGDDVLLETVTRQSAVRVAVAARSRVLRDGRVDRPERRDVEEGPVVGQDLVVEARWGEPVTVEKTVTVFTGRDPATSEPAAEAVRWLPRIGSFPALLERHVGAWSDLWRSFDVDLADDPRRLQIVRLHLLHLLQTLSPHTAELDVGVPARGLHGEAYRGHVFWDELFVLPVLDLRMPDLARALLDYRYRRLPAARARAREAGLAGAMFPWQSGSDGEEESQELHLNPLSGRWLPDPTVRQRHVGLAVAYDVWQHFQATGDRAYLVRRGAEMLIEVARCWSSMARWDRRRDRFVVRGVMGPDEFHTGYPGRELEGIDNNAYSNVMASWVLRRGLETLDLLTAPERHELLRRTNVARDEITRWRAVAQGLLVPFHDGVISQFEGYERLEELDWDAYRARYASVRRLDRILDAEGDSVNRYRASKQADAVMLFYLLSSDELREVLAHLGYTLEPAQIPRTIRYYLDRTSDGSTLSALVHAWVLARSDRRRSLDLLEQTLDADVHDIQGGTTAEGIHLAAMAGSVDLLQRCYGGLETRAERLLLDPHWPTSLGPMTFALRYRDQPVVVRVEGRDVEVRAGDGMRRPVRVSCRGQEAELWPGGAVMFPTARTAD
ncbi:glycoside hydrolase family 65 protein [Cellulosimicrobium funkei]|uniref:glycoside hydrolase family 65 protein n=1 Tax=Cellulosimicrobium funkei TaxID=264251 RepID=UPI003D7634FD